MQAPRELGDTGLINDLAAIDEDQLITSIKKKREDKAKFIEAIRDRQSHAMNLNEKIRKYDL